MFLREIVSNAAVTLDRARFHAVQDDSFLGDTEDLVIKVKHDPDAKTTSIIDSGITDYLCWFAGVVLGKTLNCSHAGLLAWSRARR